jgi:hypothetical protein
LWVRTITNCDHQVLPSVIIIMTSWHKPDTKPDTKQDKRKTPGTTSLKKPFQRSHTSLVSPSLRLIPGHCYTAELISYTVRRQRSRFFLPLTLTRQNEA